MFRNRICCILLLALCLAFSVCMPTQAQEIPREQYQILENNNRALVMKLTELELILTKQGQPLQEQLNELAKCKATLTMLEKDLNAINEKLIISQDSLERVKALQKKTEQSLKNLEKKIVRYKTQRVYGWVFGIVTSIIVIISS